MTRLSEMNFPNGSRLQDGFWRPVYFRSNFDTPERLVVAVLAFVGGQWKIERANSMERLKCLYGSEAVVALDLIQYGLDDFQSKLKDAREQPDLNVSGLELGQIYDARAQNAAELAARWLRQISSLHNGRKDFLMMTAGAQKVPVVDVISRDISKDRLSVLVMEQMEKIAPPSRRMFNAHVHKLERDERARLLSYGAYVAFDGKNVAANFSTIKPGHYKISVDVSKRLMWDLEQHRDHENSLLEKQVHEMFLYHPSKDDPTISTKQFDNVMEVVETLRGEGQNRNINVVAKDSVVDISKRLIAAEGLG